MASSAHREPNSYPWTSCPWTTSPAAWGPEAGVCSVLCPRAAASTSHQAFNVPKSVSNWQLLYPGADSPTKRAGGHCPFLLTGAGGHGGAWDHTFTHTCTEEAHTGVEDSTCQGSEQSTAVTSCPLREQRGWPVVLLRSAQQPGLAQGLLHGPQSSISVRTLTLMLSLPPWVWVWCSPGLMVTLDRFLTPHVCLCVLWEPQPHGERREAGLGRGAVGSQRGPSGVTLQREEGWYLPLAGHWESASPQLWSWAVIWDEKAHFIWRHPPQGPWAESSLMGDLGGAPQHWDIPGQLGDWKNMLWCFNWEIPLSQSRLIQGGEVTCRVMRSEVVFLLQVTLLGLEHRGPCSWGGGAEK